MKRVNIRITDKCNLQCRHCCFSCGPKGESMSAENLEKVIINVPEDTRRIIINGGEPLVEKELLMHALDYIGKKNEKRRQKIYITVMTNGFWIKDADNTYKVLRELYEKGARTLEIASDDKYHIEQGINPGLFSLADTESPLGKAVEMLKKETGNPHPVDINARHQNKHNIFAVPFGRAKQLPAKEINDKSICIAPYKFPEDITINPDGNVYPCCWAATPSIGSALEDNLGKIAQRAIKDKVFRALITEGPVGVAKLTGYYRKSDEPLYRQKQCMMCMEVFEERR